MTAMDRDKSPIIGSNDRDAIAEWFHRHTEGTDERVCYHYNQYKWDCREMADDLIESLPKRDISSDAVEGGNPFNAVGAFEDNQYVPRDISSDPVGRKVTIEADVVKSHRTSDGMLVIEEVANPRDISSVTGSAADALLTAAQRDSAGRYDYDLMGYIAAIRREAVEPLERKNAELRSALRWVRSHLRYDPPIIRDPEEVARVIDRALLEGKTDE